MNLCRSSSEIYRKKVRIIHSRQVQIAKKVLLGRSAGISLLLTFLTLVTMKDISRFVSEDEGLSRPLLGKPGMDLPGSYRLLLAENARRKKEGMEPARDQTSGDAGKMGKPAIPLGDAFFETRAGIAAQYPDIFGKNDGTATGYFDGYHTKPEPAIAAIAKHLGLDMGDISFIAADSGRGAIANLMFARSIQQKAAGANSSVIIEAPFSWPGGGALAKLQPITTGSVYSAADPNSVFVMTSECVEDAIGYAHHRGVKATSMIRPIVPDNPTGNKRMSANDLVQLAEIADREDSHLLIDLLYSVLSEEGINGAIEWDEFMKNLAPELRHRVSLLIGTTKATGSDERFVAAINLAKANPLYAIAKSEAGSALSNAPTVNATLTAAALYSTPGGPSAAMGERGVAIKGKESMLKKILDKHGIISPDGSHSYYTSAILIDGDTGESLIKDRDGNPSFLPEDTADVLLKGCDVGIASPRVWRPYYDESPSMSGVTVRFSFVVPDADIQALDSVFETLKSGSVRSTYAK